MCTLSCSHRGVPRGVCRRVLSGVGVWASVGACEDHDGRRTMFVGVHEGVPPRQHVTFRVFPSPGNAELNTPPRSKNGQTNYLDVSTTTVPAKTPLLKQTLRDSSPPTTRQHNPHEVA